MGSITEKGIPDFSRGAESLGEFGLFQVREVYFHTVTSNDWKLDARFCAPPFTNSNVSHWSEGLIKLQSEKNLQIFLSNKKKTEI